MVNNSGKGEAVYDPFLGSGTTLIAAETIGRRCYAVELNPAYVDVAIRRWCAFMGRAAVLERTGATFSDVETVGLRAGAAAPGAISRDIEAEGTTASVAIEGETISGRSVPAIDRCLQVHLTRPDAAITQRVLPIMCAGE